MEDMKRMKENKRQGKATGIVTLILCFFVTLTVVGCMSAKQASSSGKGGEVVGVGGRAFTDSIWFNSNFYWFTFLIIPVI